MTRASSFAPSSWRGAHSRSTHQRTASANRSRRFDFAALRPYAAGCAGVLAFGAALNAIGPFSVSDQWGVILWGGVSAGCATVATLWGLHAWWPDLEAERQAAEARAKAELEGHQRRWSAAARRVDELKAERARLQKAKKSYAHVQAELSELTHKMLSGEV